MLEAYLIWCQGVETQHNVRWIAGVARNDELLYYGPIRQDVCFDTVPILEYERFELLCLQSRKGESTFLARSQTLPASNEHCTCSEKLSRGPGASPELYAASLRSPAKARQPGSYCQEQDSFFRQHCLSCTSTKHTTPPRMPAV